MTMDQQTNVLRLLGAAEFILAREHPDLAAGLRQTKLAVAAMEPTIFGVSTSERSDHDAGGPGLSAAVSTSNQ